MYTKFFFGILSLLCDVDQPVDVMKALLEAVQIQDRARQPSWQTRLGGVKAKSG